MASIFSHAVAALGIGACFYRPGTPKSVWVAGAACSVIPDLDVIGFRFGVRYGDFWGHRGFTHSLLFAALLASAVAFIGFRRGVPSLGRLSLWIYLFLATASHGFLDAMTAVWELPTSPLSTITAIFFLGRPFTYPRLVLGGFSRIEVLLFSRARSFGFGSPRLLLVLPPGRSAVASLESKTDSAPVQTSNPS